MMIINLPFDNYQKGRKNKKGSRRFLHGHPRPSRKSQSLRTRKEVAIRHVYLKSRQLAVMAN